MPLLIVEDDPTTAKYLQRGLSEEGFVVDVAADGQQGLDLAGDRDYDVIVLDVMLPIIDGWGVLSQLVADGSKTPVLMLTARDSIECRVRGLTLGAEDYLVKPFAFAELLARIRNIVRRRVDQAPPVLEYADLHLDPSRHQARRGDACVQLSVKELQLLELLLRRQGQVLSRTYIAEQVWDMAFDGDSNVVDVSIRRLRAKIDDPFPTKLIHTVRGRGYVLRSAA
jgi:two-component system copper resistance phosphate regulon response regulator CusR